MWSSTQPLLSETSWDQHISIFNMQLVLHTNYTTYTCALGASYMWHKRRRRESRCANSASDCGDSVPGKTRTGGYWRNRALTIFSTSKAIGFSAHHVSPSRFGTFSDVNYVPPVQRRLSKLFTVYSVAWLLVCALMLYLWSTIRAQKPFFSPIPFRLSIDRFILFLLFIIGQWTGDAAISLLPTSL